MVQLDAAAMNLKRRFEDPTIAAQMEAQQAYTRALAPAGESSLCYNMNHVALVHSQQQHNWPWAMHASRDLAFCWLLCGLRC